MTTAIPTATGSQLAPSFEHARVADAMRHGVITCPPDTPLITVARMMASYHVHAIVVTLPEPEADSAGESPWGVVTDSAILRRAARADELTARGAVDMNVVRVSAHDLLADAAARMADHGTTHAIVVGGEDERPLGMISSLDVAGVVAWGRA